MHPLDGAYSKLARAQEHFIALKEAFGRHDNSITIRPKLDRHIGDEFAEFSIEVIKANPVPMNVWGPLLGDAMHNMRSALDHIAYALVAKCQGAPWDKSQFPIADAPERLNWRDKGTLGRLDTDERTFIERHQPYDRGKALAILRDISNEDKHRLLVLVMMEAEVNLGAKMIRDCADPEWLGPPSADNTLKPGAIIERLRVRVTGPEPQMQVKHTHSPYIALDKWGRAQDVLNLIIGEVSAVYKEATAFFPERPEGRPAQD